MASPAKLTHIRIKLSIDTYAALLLLNNSIKNPVQKKDINLKPIDKAKETLNIIRFSLFARYKVAF